MDHTFTMQPVIILLASVVALFFGPFFHALFNHRESLQTKLLHIIDGFSLIVILDLVIIHILPHTFEDVGLSSLIFCLLGLLIPTLLERHYHKLAHSAHTYTVLIALFGMALHAITDGMAIINPYATAHTVHMDNPDHSLSLAVLIHRLPVGLAVWGLIQPVYGVKKALWMLIVMSLATMFGFSIGQNVFPGSSHHYLGAFEAFIAGTLLHVVLHRHNHNQKPCCPNLSAKLSGIGATIGVATSIAMIQFLPQHHVQTGLQIFKDLALQSAPALILGYAMSGMIQAYLPTSSVAWMRRGSKLSQSLRGMAFGLPMPICSCGVVPVYRSLMKQGLPLSAGLSFFVATPELGLDAVLISIPLLGPEFTTLRVIAAALVALLIGWLMGMWFDKKYKLTKENTETAKNKKLTLKEKWQLVWKTGFEEVVDHTGPWILVGLVIAAMAHPILSQGSLFAELPDFYEVLLFAVLGMPVYVCAAGATPLVAILILNGVSPGAALAFLLIGPATNITTFGVLSQMHSRKIALSFAALMITLSVVAGMAVNQWYTSPIEIPALSHQHDSLGLLKITAAVLLAVIFWYSLIRKGPRYWINQIINFEGGEHKHHKHDEGSCH